MLYVRTCKEGDKRRWFYFTPIHVTYNEEKYKSIYKQIEEDYYSICRQLKEHIETSPDGYIHTSNGKYIQIRSKDAKPYRPIYSNIYGREVSNKNHAFYFKKEFMNAIISEM